MNIGIRSGKAGRRREAKREAEEREAEERELWPERCERKREVVGGLSCGGENESLREAESSAGRL